MSLAKTTSAISTDDEFVAAAKAFIKRQHAAGKPFFVADVTSNTYYYWDRFLHHDYILLGAYAIAGKFAATFKEFPPVQRPGSFTIDDALAKVADATSGGAH